MNKKEMLIEYAKEIAEYCDEQDECNENCAFYTESGDHVCLFNTAYMPCGWKLSMVEK